MIVTVISIYAVIYYLVCTWVGHSTPKNVGVMLAPAPALRMRVSIEHLANIM